MKIVDLNIGPECEVDVELSGGVVTFKLDEKTPGIFATSGMGTRISSSGRLVHGFVLRRESALLGALAFSDDHGETWKLGAEIGRIPRGIAVPATVVVPALPAACTGAAGRYCSRSFNSVWFTPGRVASVE